VRITVAESYGIAKGVSLPFEDLAQTLLKYAGLRVVSSDEKSYDATLRIQAKGSPIGAKYNLGYFYTGARFKGKILFEIQGGRSFKKKFDGELLPFKKESVLYLQRSPSDAPFPYLFDKFFRPAIFDMIGEIYGVHYWISVLKDLRYHENALEKLIKIGEPAVEPLITALEDKDISVRVGAARALGGIKYNRALEPLIVTLKDENASVRMWAAEALGEIEDPGAAEALGVALTDADPRVRIAAESALKKIRKQ
jgi:HEAT repeats